MLLVSSCRNGSQSFCGYWMLLRNSLLVSVACCIDQWLSGTDHWWWCLAYRFGKCLKGLRSKRKIRRILCLHGKAFPPPLFPLTGLTRYHWWSYCEKKHQSNFWKAHHLWIHFFNYTPSLSCMLIWLRSWMGSRIKKGVCGKGFEMARVVRRICHAW